MTNSIIIISKVLPVILLIILGSILRITGFLKQSTIDELKKIIVNISLPALLFMAFAGTEFKGSYFFIFISVFLTCLLMLALGVVLKAVFKVDNRYYPTLFSGFETGMMGYSIFVAVYGAENMFKLAIIDLGQVTFVFFVLVSYLQKLNGKSETVGKVALSFVKSPVILSIMVGIIIGISGVFGTIEAYPVSNSVVELLKLLSNLTMPVICIVIGYELQIDIKNLGKPFLSAFIRTVVLLFIAFLINEFLIERVMHLDNMFKTALYTMFLLPPPFVIPIFMEEKEIKNKQFVLNTISLNIILSLTAFLFLILII